MTQKHIEAMQNYLDTLIKEENIHRRELRKCKQGSLKYIAHKKLYLMRKRERQQIILENLENSLRELSVNNRCGKNGAHILALEYLG